MSKLSAKRVSFVALPFNRAFAPGTELLEGRLIGEKVMTNKRIHVSAIVLLIAAIIIDMNNNALCPGHATAPAAWVPS